MQRLGGGANLFEGMARMRAILRGLRAHFAGPLLVKIRLGQAAKGWLDRLRDRLRLFEVRPGKWTSCKPVGAFASCPR